MSERPNLIQPWKEHWPANEEVAEGPSHACPKGAILYPNGDTVSKPKDKIEALSGQTQPWKAHWPATEEADGPSHDCPEGTTLYPNGDTASKPAGRNEVKSNSEAGY